MPPNVVVDGGDDTDDMFDLIMKYIYEFLQGLSNLASGRPDHVQTTADQL